MKLEDVENLALAHPYIKAIERQTTCYTEQEANDAAHGELVVSSKSEEGDAEKTVYRVLETSILHIGLRLVPKDTTSGQPRTLDLSWPTKDFTNLVKNWEHYNERTMGVVVKYIKRWRYGRGICSGRLSDADSVFCFALPPFLLARFSSSLPPEALPEETRARVKRTNSDVSVLKNGDRLNHHQQHHCLRLLFSSIAINRTKWSGGRGRNL